MDLGLFVKLLYFDFLELNMILLLITLFLNISQFIFIFIQSIRLWAKLVSFFFLFSYVKDIHCSPCLILKRHVANKIFDFIKEIIIDFFFFIFNVISSFFMIKSNKLKKISKP